MILSFHKISLSCDCLPPTLNNSIKEANVIFIGKIVEIIDSSRIYTYTDFEIGRQSPVVNFEVINYYKERKGKYLSILTTSFESSECNVDYKNEYKKGDTLIVFANFINACKHEKFEPRQLYYHKYLETSACSMIDKISNIKDSELLSFIKDKSNWVRPYEYIDMPFVYDIKVRKSKVITKMNYELWGLVVSLLINIILMIIIIKKRKTSR